MFVAALVWRKMVHRCDFPWHASKAVAYIPIDVTLEKKKEMKKEKQHTGHDSLSAIRM